MFCPHCSTKIDSPSDKCRVTSAPSRLDGKPRLAADERAQHRRETQRRYYLSHKVERREKRLAESRAYYERNREAILQRLRLKRIAAKEIQGKENGAEEVYLLPRAPIDSPPASS